MTTSADLMDAVAAAIVAGDTDAGLRVYTPGDWPTWDSQYPAIKLRVYRETKTSTGRGEIGFTVLTTVRILAQVSEPASSDDGGAAMAEVALWRLKQQIEVAVINSYPLTALLQQFPSVDSQLAFSSEGETHLAGLQIDLGLEFYQGPSDFAPSATTDIAEVGVNASVYPPAGLDLRFPGVTA